jgi:asparagine synthase (glutamine-hydrolysing)
VTADAHVPASPLTRLERAVGLAIGTDRDAPPLGRERSLAPRAAIDAVIRGALERPPCVVSFSGGRDSSVVLALAAAEAGRAGLPAPVPVTLRFPGVAETEESEWQERVVRHLGLPDWQRVEIGEELDFLGPLARAGLQRHGRLFPPNTHFHVPIFERARGGSVLTGFDGDGLLVAWRWQRAQAALHRQVRPQLRDPLRVALALAPAAVKRAVLSRGAAVGASWLKPAAAEEAIGVLVAEEARQPRRWDRRLDHYVSTRFHRLPIHSLQLLADPHDAQVVHPLADRRFLASLAHHGGAAGYGDRTAATRALFGDLLPDDVLERRTKAEFGFAMWGPEALAFAGSWDGSGVDPELVDAGALREAWAEPNPAFAAATLLQGAWLATRTPEGAPQPPAPGRSSPEGG